MSEDSCSDQLNSSKLGTKEHWDGVYEVELGNFSECGDEGEIWFGESSSRRMVKCICSLEVATHEPIVDLGCGNGMMIVHLWESGYRNILGIDYSQKAIELASSIASSKGCLASFEVRNILEWNESDCHFKVVLDKGTYDAISLDPKNPNEKRERYKCSVFKLLQDGGYFLITSCNWTEQELKNHFSSNFTYISTLPTPKMSFGGKCGSTVSAVVFKK